MLRAEVMKALANNRSDGRQGAIYRKRVEEAMESFRREGGLYWLKNAVCLVSTPREAKYENCMK